MNAAQQQIREFMVNARQATPDRPAMPGADVRVLRVKLIAEELIELARALGIHLRIDTDGGQDIPEARIVASPIAKTDLVESYDAVLDLLVVVIGTGVALGLDIEPGWQEVHRSNMSKFIDGHLREDGKWVKGPSYSPAALRPIVDRQLAQPL